MNWRRIHELKKKDSCGEDDGMSLVSKKKQEGSCATASGILEVAMILYRSQKKCIQETSEKNEILDFLDCFVSMVMHYLSEMLLSHTKAKRSLACFAFRIRKVNQKQMDSSFRNFTSISCYALLWRCNKTQFCPCCMFDGKLLWNFPGNVLELAFDRKISEVIFEGVLKG